MFSTQSTCLSFALAFFPSVIINLKTWLWKRWMVDTCEEDDVEVDIDVNDDDDDCCCRCVVVLMAFWCRLIVSLDFVSCHSSFHFVFLSFDYSRSWRPWHLCIHLDTLLVPAHFGHFPAVAMFLRQGKDSFHFDPFFFSFSFIPSVSSRLVSFRLVSFRFLLFLPFLPSLTFRYLHFLRLEKDIIRTNFDGSRTNTFVGWRIILSVTPLSILFYKYHRRLVSS